MELEYALCIWDLDLEYEFCLNLLEDFDFQALKAEIETDINIVPNLFLFQRKARVKVKGLIWVIHRYDADPFPSNPHAHSLDQNIKLDLSNGKCYRKRDYLYTIQPKHLLEIREAAQKVFKGTLPLLDN